MRMPALYEDFIGDVFPVDARESFWWFTHEMAFICGIEDVASGCV